MPLVPERIAIWTPQRTGVGQAESDGETEGRSSGRGVDSVQRVQPVARAEREQGEDAGAAYTGSLCRSAACATAFGPCLVNAGQEEAGVLGHGRHGARPSGCHSPHDATPSYRVRTRTPSRSPLRPCATAAVPAQDGDGMLSFEEASKFHDVRPVPRSPCAQPRVCSVTRARSRAHERVRCARFARRSRAARAP